MTAKNTAKMKVQMPNYDERLQGLKLKLAPGECVVINDSLYIQVRFVERGGVSLCFHGDRNQWKIDRKI